MLYSEIIAVCSQIHTKHINTLCGQNVEFVDIKHGGTISDYWALITVINTCKEESFPCLSELRNVTHIDF
jgi:hypothetical protein